jgi:hypothetical protein
VSLVALGFAVAIDNDDAILGTGLNDKQDLFACAGRPSAELPWWSI